MYCSPSHIYAPKHCLNGYLRARTLFAALNAHPSPIQLLRTPPSHRQPTAGQISPPPFPSFEGQKKKKSLGRRSYHHLPLFTSPSSPPQPLSAFPLIQFKEVTRHITQVSSLNRDLTNQQEDQFILGPPTSSDYSPTRLRHTPTRHDRSCRTSASSSLAMVAVNTL